MTRAGSLAFCAALTTAMTLLGCSSSTRAGADSGSGSEADGGKPASPATLRQFESGAEAMSESARGTLPGHIPDWPTAKMAYVEDNTLWQGLKAQLNSAGATAATLRAIDAALAAYAIDLSNMDQRGAETDANKITIAIPDAFDVFTYTAPTDTLRLDGGFRELQIDAEYSDWAGCANALEATITIWTRLKVPVAAQAPKRPDIAGSATVVADVDATIQGAQAIIADDGGVALDSANLEQLAQKGLDQTDTCEQIFK